MKSTRLHIVYWTIIAASVLVTALVTGNLAKTSPPDSSVYLVGAVTITDPERLPEYQAVAGPLAGRFGGYLPLAFAEPRMIEGIPPTEGLYFIERYHSHDGLMAFLNSPKFKEAKKLRDKVADVHFMLWLPALPAGSLPH